MTKEETKQILQILRLNYPNSFKNLSNKDTFDFLDLWSEAFKDDDVRTVILAVKSIIYTDTREFYPNIAQVKKEMYRITHHDSLDEYEAWNHVIQVVRNCRFEEYAKENFERLPLEVQKAIGTYRNLYEWSDLDDLTFVANNFYKAYKKIQNDNFKVNALPIEMKNILKIENKDRILIEAKEEKEIEKPSEEEIINLQELLSKL